MEENTVVPQMIETELDFAPVKYSPPTISSFFNSTNRNFIEDKTI